MPARCDGRWAHIVGTAILVFIKYDVGVDFQAEGFRRLAAVMVGVFRSLAGVMAEDGLENELEGNIIREEADRKVERIKNLRRKKLQKGNMWKESAD